MPYMGITLFRGLTSPDLISSPHRIVREQVIPIALERVFDFFADAANLESITPPWLNFRILTPRPIGMQSGTLIDYQIRWSGIPLRWQSEIREWNPPHEFTDVQLIGPYRLWHHRHEFQSHRVDGQNVTHMRDIVQYALPVTGVSWLAHAMIVRKDLERIFDYRRTMINRYFGTTDQSVSIPLQKFAGNS